MAERTSFRVNSCEYIFGQVVETYLQSGTLGDMFFHRSAFDFVNVMFELLSMVNKCDLTVDKTSLQSSACTKCVY